MQFTASVKSGVSAAALAVSLFAGHSTAHAQDQADSTDSGIGEIVVTAQFRNQSLQDTPLSITAIDAETMEARGQTEVAQIAQQAPNVVLLEGGGLFGPSIGAQIRGVGQFDSNPAYEPGVGMYVDDVYLATLNGAALDLLDLERVEVLRGPQGTLTGRNSIGGAVKLYSKRPDGTTGASFELEGGSRNLLSGRASANLKISDTLSARVAFVHKQQDGYVDRLDYGCANPGNPEGIPSHSATGKCLVSKLGETNYTGARLVLRYQSGSVDWLISGDYTTQGNSGAANVPMFGDARVPAGFICGPYCTYADYSGSAGRPLLGAQPGQLSTAIAVSDQVKNRGWGVSSNLSVDLTDNLKLQAITAYRHYKVSFASDDDLTPGPIQGVGYTENTHRFFSQELRLNGSVGSLLDWTIGGFYSDQKTVTYHLGDVGFLAPPFTVQFYSDDPVNANSKAAFATAILHPADGLTLTGGIRYTEESKDYTFVRRNLDGTVNTALDPDPLNPINGLVSRFKGNRVDYRVSLDYRIAPELLAYATVSTGFKGGGVSARPFNEMQARLGAFGPETLTAYEIGLKADLFDRRLRVNLAGFISDYNGIQLQLSDCTAYGGGPICAVIANAGNARFKGFEAEVTARPVDGLDIEASLSHLDAQWKSISPAATGVPNGIFSSDPATSAPRWKASAGAQYRIDMGSNGSLTPRVDWSYQGRTFQGRGTFAPTYLPSYSLVNATITWRDAHDKFSIALQARNLLNKFYQTIQHNEFFLPLGISFSDIGAPQEFSIKARYNF